MRVSLAMWARALYRSTGPFLFLLFVSQAIIGCGASLKQPPAEGADAVPEELILIEESPNSLADGLNFKDLAEALFEQERYLLARPSGSMISLGAEQIPIERYRVFIQALRRVLIESPQTLEQWIRQHARIMRVSASSGSAGLAPDILVTGYYEPVILGSRQQTAQYSEPLYARPPDLVSVDISQFRQRLRDEPPIYGRLTNRRVVPYYTRQELEEQRPLAAKGLELCWVDPVDAFFIQIQGSGTVRFADGSELVLGYADKNGRAYTAIGRFLTDIIPLSEITTQKIVQHLRSLPAPQARELMQRNQSYVFFQPSAVHARTFSGAPATAQRTIATDRSLFSKGLVGFLDFTDGAMASRFVVDQDIGGAITGPRRADLFIGRGTEAGEFAGALKARAVLYYLVPRGYAARMISELPNLESP